MTKSYHQYCPVATGLDHLGDRWTFLILRDLAWYGPARFSDWIHHNAGLPPALLSARLRSLIGDGMVEHDDLNRYRLTDAGSAVRGVVDALAVFGGQFLATEDPTEARLGYLARRLTSLHAEGLAEIGPVAINFDVEGRNFSFEIDANGVRIGAQRGDAPVVVTDRAGLANLLSGKAGLEVTRVTGNRRLVEDHLRFLQPVAA